MTLSPYRVLLTFSRATNSSFSSNLGFFRWIPLQSNHRGEANSGQNAQEGVETTFAVLLTACSCCGWPGET